MAERGDSRIDSIDLLRGLVMAIMALDHVRDFLHSGAQQFSPEDLTRTDGLLFFTRWITHFCAPIFVFLAGLSVHLSQSKRAGTGRVSRFLLSRGLWLILLELTVLNWAISFRPASPYLLLQVLWVTGWSMMALAGLIWLRRPLILAIAVGMIALHNTLDGVSPAVFGSGAWVWNLLHVPTLLPWAGHQIIVAYPLIPWIGVMAAGYCLGPVMQMEPSRRRRILLRLGAGLTAAFLVLRFANVYGDARVWAVQGKTVMTVVAFFNVTKYPPSLLYLLMTLGPGLLTLGFLDGVRVQPRNFFRVLGRVPLFYYFAHFYLAHVIAVGLALARYGQAGFLFEFPVAVMGLPAPAYPVDYGYSLGTVYLVWLLLVSFLYFPCRWYMKVKQGSSSIWFSYL